MAPTNPRHDLEDAVETVFGRTAAGMVRWDDPHPDRVVADDEYSRVTDPSRWRILGARLDAWIEAVAGAGLATVERGATVGWAEPPGPVVARADVVSPAVTGGLALVACRSRIASVDDAGITLGVRRGPDDPAVMFAIIPDCGCDACDSGSHDALDELDEHIRAVLSGDFRLLRRKRQRIMVLGDGRRQASNFGLGPAADRVLADPRGWDEHSGPSWFARASRDRRPSEPSR